MRERVAGILQRAGALGAAMRLRKLGPVGTLSVLTYHHVAERDPAYPYDPGVADATPAQFRRQLEAIGKYATIVGIDELCRALEGEPLPKNAVMITFDDGYRSCHDTALPILKSLGMKAVFFIATSFISERRLYWWEKIALILSQAKQERASIAYPEPRELDRTDPKLLKSLNAVVKDTKNLDVDRFVGELGAAFGITWTQAQEALYADGLIMTWDHVRALAKAGMDIESHSRRHRVLQTLDDAALADELTGSREELQAQLHRPVRAIAYPVGRRIDRDERLRGAMTAAGYTIGFSNMSGVNRIWPRRMRPIDPFNVKRLATDRDMSDAMYLTQIAVPPLAYIADANR
ncbi:MAG TPA: polysaccharide deacetylase family protein [Kofleriaceae bacterium]|jgi:peptidoglycan/xylan/chitin deacetylase (PgdA/CDA1 family)